MLMMKVDFPPTLRKLVEGYFGYVDGGYQGTINLSEVQYLRVSLSRFAWVCVCYVVPRFSGICTSVSAQTIDDWI